MQNRKLKPSRVKSKLKSIWRVYEFEVSQCYFVIFVHFLFSSKANATCSVIANRMVSSGTEVGNLWPVDWIPAFINNALLEHSSVHLLTYCPWLHSCYSGRQSWVTELWETTLPTNVYYLAIYRKVCRHLLPPKCYQWNAQYQKYKCNAHREHLGYLKNRGQLLYD